VSSTTPRSAHGPGPSRRLLSWQRRWSSEDFQPGWLTADIPEEVVRAVDSGWFPRGGELLEVGCGRGDIAAWLAHRGFVVTAVDFAPAAIARSRARHGETGDTLSFQVADVTVDPLAGFHRCLFDRGCFHALPEADREAYARNVASACRADARFLLLHKLGGYDAPASSLERRRRVTRGLGRHLGPWFEFVEVAQTTLGRSRSGNVDGVAVWMVRNDAAGTGLGGPRGRGTA